MSRATRGVRAGFVAVVLASVGGCGSGDADKTPNPALGPPPKLEPGRSGVPPAVEKAAKPKKAN